MIQSSSSYIKGLDKSYKMLLAMKACTIGDIPTDCPTGGVYLSLENAEASLRRQNKKINQSQAARSRHA